MINWTFIKSQITLAITFCVLNSAQASMNSDYSKALHLGRRADAETVAEARKRHWVFVAGYLNGEHRNDFAPWAKILNEYGISYSIAHPPSDKSVAENAEDYLAKHLREVSKKTGLPLIVVGQSKGALEAAATLIQTKDDLLNGSHPVAIDRVVLLQGPVDGNLALDIQGSLPARIRDTNAAIHAVNPFWPSFDGWHSLNSDEIFKTIKLPLLTLRSNDDERFKQIDEILLYVASYKDPMLTPILLRNGAIEMRYTHGNINDGAVATEKMFLTFVGRLLGFIEGVDHVESLMDRQPLPAWRKTSSAQALIEALLINVIRDIYRPDLTMQGEAALINTIDKMNDLKLVKPTLGERCSAAFTEIITRR